MSLVTVGKADPRFRDFLLGEPEPGQVVIPVKTLSPNSSHEMVTFRLIPSTDISRPRFWWARLLRVESLWMILTPVLYVYLASHYQISSVHLAIVGLGLVALSTSAFLFNDYYDHIKGLDRVLSYSGTGAIQSGWVTAKQVYRFAFVMLFMAVLCGLLVLSWQPGLLYFLAPIALFLVVEYASDRLAMKYRPAGEVIIFCLFGPLLAVSCELALTGLWSQQVALFGLLWGGLIVLDQTVRSFSNCMLYEKAHVRNLSSKLGFEGTRVFICGLCGVLLAAISGFSIWQGHLVAPGLFAVSVVPVLWLLWQISSPVSSRFTRLRVASRTLVFLTGLGFLLSLVSIEKWKSLLSSLGL